MTKPYHHGALREALLAAAERIIESAGVDGLSLRAIARDAGVSQAAPTHHFDNLTGLLSELAARGFERFSARLEAGAAGADDPGKRVSEMCRAYVGFARDSPGLFELMFRSALLDWSRPALAAAGARAFTVLLEHGAGSTPDLPQTDRVSAAMTTWSLVHGLSMLIIDGRLGPMLKKFSGPDVETLSETIFAVAGFQNAIDSGEMA
jgi:AcrR family transcriptional regulator